MKPIEGLKVGDLFTCDAFAINNQRSKITGFEEDKVIISSGFIAYPFSGISDEYYVNGKLYKRENITIPQIESIKSKIIINDPVNNPSHYNYGNIQCLDAIQSQLGEDGFIAFLRGTIAKYNWRLLHKDNPLQDAKKMEFYIKRLINELESKV